MSDTDDGQLDSLREGLESLKAKHEGSAVDPSSVKTGVPNDEKFETLAADMHGYGSGEFSKIDVRIPSTPGENFKEPERAGNVYDGQGRMPDPPLETVWDSKTGEQRQRHRRDYYDRNDPKTVSGTPEEIVSDDGDEVDAPVERLMSEPPGGRAMHKVNFAGDSVSDGGGGSSGRKHRKQGTMPVCPDCHLQLCVCRESEDGARKRPGPKRRYEDEKLEAIRIRVRPSDVETIKEAGLKFSQVAEREIAKIAECLRSGKKWDEIA